MFLGKIFRLSIVCFLTGIGNLWSVDEASRVVILANSDDPGSLEIADYYADKRSIPAANIISLPMSDKETISLREYVDTLHNPLLNALVEKGWLRAVKAQELDFIGRELVSVGLHKISYLVTTRGVPLRISNDPELLDPRLGKVPDQFRVNNASVDSELALLIGPPRISMTAFIANPFFENKKPIPVKTERVIRVSRLDGPDVESIKRLIDHTLEAEAEGLAGRAYFDIGGPHGLGDEWIRAAHDLAEDAFFGTDLEPSKRLMDETDRFDAPAIYMGWYRRNAYGPWRELRWPVPPGAIGFHLHSFSATTVRSTSSGWLGAFVKQGYCATVGNVYEPYLEYTHRPDRLLRALLDGSTFGEAVMLSNPVLSWQGVAIGDPLYRPFKVDLATQLERADGNSLDAYVYLREINRLEASDKFGEALLFAESKYRAQPSLPLAKKLAQLYLECDEEEKAFKALKVACSIDVFAQDEVALAKKMADLLNKKGERKSALGIYKKLISQKNLNTVQQIALLEDGAALALRSGEGKLSSQWVEIAESLKQ